MRDDDFKPEDVHIRLLCLPWRDVFTTNWDTLLERSLTSVHERKYSIVRNKDEIPLADQPRIVKLHGSFPAHFRHCHVNRVGPKRPAWIPFQAAALALSHRLNASFRNRLNVNLLHK